MRAMLIVLPASILLSVAAAAQDQGKDSSGRAPPPATAGKNIPQAPVGHRQPTQRSLPPAARKDEDAGTKPPDPLGPIPSICKNC